MRTCGQGPWVLVRWLPRRSHTVTSFASTEQQRVQTLDGGKREKCDPARQSTFPARSVNAHRAEFRPNTLSTSYFGLRAFFD